MPIYEYEHLDDLEGAMCPLRVEVLQGINEATLESCPYCGLEVRRVVSQAGFTLRQRSNADKAATRGFSTFKRAQRGVWEKVAGPNTPTPSDE